MEFDSVLNQQSICGKIVCLILSVEVGVFQSGGHCISYCKVRFCMCCAKYVASEWHIFSEIGMSCNGSKGDVLAEKPVGVLN